MSSADQRQQHQQPHQHLLADTAAVIEQDFDKLLLTSSSNKLNAKHFNKHHQPEHVSLTAETLKVFSSINIENLNFNSKLDLLFNDLGMLKASAVQGCLEGTSLRSLAWMIFLECIPLEKSNWIATVKSNRAVYDKLKKELSCDPRAQSNEERLDHPLSQNKEVV